MTWRNSNTVESQASVPTGAGPRRDPFFRGAGLPNTSDGADTRLRSCASPSFQHGPLSLHSRIACRATDARRVHPSTSALAPEDLQEHQDQLVTTRDYAD